MYTKVWAVAYRNYGKAHKRPLNHHLLFIEIHKSNMHAQATCDLSTSVGVSEGDFHMCLSQLNVNFVVTSQVSG